jgi:hypothetical protein
VAGEKVMSDFLHLEIRVIGDALPVKHVSQGLVSDDTQESVACPRARQL